MLIVFYRWCLWYRTVLLNWFHCIRVLDIITRITAWFSQNVVHHVSGSNFIVLNKCLSKTSTFPANISKLHIIIMLSIIINLFISIRDDNQVYQLTCRLSICGYESSSASNYIRKYYFVVLVLHYLRFYLFICLFIVSCINWQYFTKKQIKLTTSKL